MNLKELFDTAENGTLTYDQLIAAAGDKAKFVDLSEGNYVDKQKYTDELAARDTRITALNETLNARDTDLASLKTQLDAAGVDATKLSEATANLAALQAKYEKDTKALAKQMKDQAYKHAVNDFANTLKFSSQAAKRDFVSSMLAKNLQLDNDVLIGATDFVTAYTQDNADAFVSEESSSSNFESKPHFVDSTSSSGGSGEEVSPFQFNFTGVRPHGKE